LGTSKSAPLVIEENSVVLKSVLNLGIGIPVFFLQFDGAAEKVKPMPALRPKTAFLRSTAEWPVNNFR
jgi:hypothetical protein